MRASLGFYFVSAILLFFTGAALAEKEKPQIKYVSLSETVEKTGEEKRILETLESEKSRIESEIQKRAKKLNEKVKNIKKDASLLSENERFKKAEEIEMEKMELERFAEMQKLNLQKREAVLKQRAIEKVKQATARVAKDEIVDAIKNKDDFLWVKPDLDLTGRVVRQFKKTNKKK